MTKVLHQTVYRYLLILAVCTVTILSLLPIERLPQGFNWWDKAQHALAYFTLGILAIHASPSPRHRIFLLLLLFVHGCLIELLQALSGWRFGEWQDVMANSVGLVGVTLLHWAYSKWASRFNLSK